MSITWKRFRPFIVVLGPSLAACQPASPAAAPAGQERISPCEAVRLNRGALESQAKAFVLHLTSDRLQGAPEPGARIELARLAGSHRLAGAQSAGRACWGQ